MSWEILKFELRYHLRQPLFYILFVIFFFLTFGAVTSDAVQIGGALGNVNRNAPFVIMQLLLVMSVFGVLTTTAYVASAINRDFEFNTDSLFFVAGEEEPVSLRPLHRSVHRLQPGLPRRGDGDHDRLVHAVAGQGAPRRVHAQAVRVLVLRVDPAEPLPLRGDLLRRRRADAQPHGHVHLGGRVLRRVRRLARFAARHLESEKIGMLLDPFGFSPFARTTLLDGVREEQQAPALDGIFLANRLLWIGVALVLLGLTFAFFKMEVGSASAKKKKKAAANDEALIPAGVAIPQVAQRFGGWPRCASTSRPSASRGAILKSTPSSSSSAGDPQRDRRCGLR